MNTLICVTGNEVKFRLAQDAFAKFGIKIEQVLLDIDEIQGEDPEPIIIRKAQDAFARLNKPLVVTDDSWSIPALNGFPGPYMKSVNHWFSTEDFLRLTHGLDDKRIFLNQLVAYIDEGQSVVFRKDVPGMLVSHASGVYGQPIQKVASLEPEANRTISEIYDAGEQGDITGTDDAWHQLAKWYRDNLG